MALSSAKTRERASNAGSQVGVLNMPRNIDLFKVEKPGMYQMIILPYTVPQGARHPDAKPGELHYMREYYIHRNFGPSGKDYAICPRLTVGDRCPICEAIKQQLANGDITKEIAKKMSASHRTLYNVYLPKENKVVLFDTSFYAFSEVLHAAVDAKVQIPGMEWADYFADPVEGSTLYVQYIEQPLPSPGAKFCKVASIDFVKHKEPVSPDILAQAVALDNALIIEKYDDLKARFWDAETTATESEPEPEAPVTRTQVAMTQPVAQTPVATKPVEVPPPPAAAVESPKVTGKGFAKNQGVFHKELGAVTFVKSTDGSATVLNSEDDPVKVKLADLSDSPWADTQPASVSEPAAAAVSAEGDDAWDADWE